MKEKIIALILYVLLVVSCGIKASRQEVSMKAMSLRTTIINVPQVNSINHKQNDDNVFFHLPPEENELCELLVDTIVEIVKADHIQCVFYDMHAVAASLCNRFIHGDSQVVEGYLQYCALNAHHKTNSHFLQALLKTLKEYNECNPTKVSFYGIDMTTKPLGWTVLLKHVQDFRETTVIDSLERYCYDPDVQIHQQADNTARMMENERERMQELLGEDYFMWLRYVKALSDEKKSGLSVISESKKIDSLIYEDYLWLDSIVSGKKLVLWTQEMCNISGD